jgi:hypothetical protein
MKSCPQTTLFGDHTRGATANATVFSQANINVEYTIPRWIGYTADMVPFEDVGIVPQIAIAPGASSFNDSLQRDYVLERAMLSLNQPKLSLVTNSTNKLVFSCPSPPAMNIRCCALPILFKARGPSRPVGLQTALLALWFIPIASRNPSNSTGLKSPPFRNPGLKNIFTFFEGWTAIVQPSLP